MWDLDNLIDETTEVEPLILNLGQDNCYMTDYRVVWSQFLSF